ncbi:MAG TPA: DedA family protein [Candidatus Competibacteraceae bacterium]|nr:DedA family protein [Candidatus Competibacteraceae bacterium]
MLQTLIEQYGYPIILIGTFFEGEMVLVLGGLAAKLRYLELHWVMLCAFIGTVLGDQLYFFIGRYYGKSLLARHPKWQRRAAWVSRHLERHHVPLILGFRYLYGIRSVVPFAIGMSGLSTPRFLVLHVIGAALWAAGVGLIGYLFGNVAEQILGDLEKVDHILLGIVAAVSLCGWLYYNYRRRLLARAR